MEETKNQKTVVSYESKRKRLGLFISFGILGLILIGGIVFVFLYTNKDTKIAAIDDTVTSIGDFLTNTEGIDKDVADLPENFLDAEVVSTTDVDKSVSNIDTQLKELDSLSTDFDIQTTDIGL